MLAAFNSSRDYSSHAPLSITADGSSHTGTFRSDSFVAITGGGEKAVLTSAGNTVLDQANRTNQTTFADNQTVNKTFVDSHEGAATTVHHELVASGANYSSPPGAYQSIRGLEFTVGASDIHMDRLLWPKSNWSTGEVSLRNVKVFLGNSLKLNVYWSVNDGSDDINYFHPVDLVLEATKTYVIAFYISSSESGIIRSSMTTGPDITLGNALSRNATNSHVAALPSTVATHCVGSFRYTLGNARKEIKHLLCTEDAVLKTFHYPLLKINDHMMGNSLQYSPITVGAVQFLRQDKLRLGTTTAVSSGSVQYNTSTTAFEVIMRWKWTNTTYDSSNPPQFVTLEWLGSSAFDLEIRPTASNKLRLRFIYGSVVLKEQFVDYYTLNGPNFLRAEWHKDPSGTWRLDCYMYESSTTPLFAAKADVSTYPTLSSTFLRITGGAIGVGSGRATACDITQISVSSEPRREASIEIADGKVVVTGSFETRGLKASDYAKLKSGVRAGSLINNGSIQVTKTLSVADVVTVKPDSGDATTRIIGAGSSDDATLLLGAGGAGKSFSHVFDGSASQYKLQRSHGGSNYNVLIADKATDHIAISGSTIVGQGVDTSGSFANVSLKVDSNGGSHGLLLPTATLSQLSAIKSVAPSGLFMYCGDVAEKSPYIQTGGAWHRMITDRESVERYMLDREVTSSKGGRILNGGSGTSTSYVSLDDPIYPMITGLQCDPGDRLVISGVLNIITDAALGVGDHDLASIDVYKNNTVQNTNLISPGENPMVGAGSHHQIFNFPSFSFDISPSLSQAERNLKILFNYKASTSAARHIGLVGSRCFIRVAVFKKTKVYI